MTVAPFVPAFVVSGGCFALLPTRDAGAYPFVFQCFPEPIGVLAAISKQPVDIRQTANHCPCPDVVTHQSSGDHQQVAFHGTSENRAQGAPSAHRPNRKDQTCSPLDFRTENHDARRKSMGPDPRRYHRRQSTTTALRRQ